MMLIGLRARGIFHLEDNVLLECKERSVFVMGNDIFKMAANSLALDMENASAT